MVVALVICHVGVPLIKEMIDRPRPDGGLVDASGSSYPSGHAAYAVIYTWLALIDHGAVTAGADVRVGADRGGLALTAAVGLSRVYLNVHYLSDVSGGWALGVSAFASCAMVALIVTRLRQNRRPMLTLAEIGTEYFLFGGAGLISLLAFTALILVPAVGSFGAPWEKATAGMLSLFVLVALLAIGLAVGRVDRLLLGRHQTLFDRH